MTEAEEVRYNETQDLMKNLRLQLNEVEEGQGGRAINFAFARLLLDFLENGEISRRDEPASNFFRLKALPMVEKFSQSEEERNALLSDFLDYVTERVTETFREEFGIYYRATHSAEFPAESTKTPC